MSGLQQTTQEVAKQAFYASVKYSAGGDIEVKVCTEEVQVVRDVLVAAVSLGALYAGYKLLQPLIKGAVTKAFGGEREDQDTPKIKPGSLIVFLHCFTDERFLEFLNDYECGRLKERLQKEFSEIGFEIKGMNVQIINQKEVNKTKEAICKRYVSQI